MTLSNFFVIVLVGSDRYWEFGAFLFRSVGVIVGEPDNWVIEKSRSRLSGIPLHDFNKCTHTNSSYQSHHCIFIACTVQFLINLLHFLFYCVQKDTIIDVSIEEFVFNKHCHFHFFKVFSIFLRLQGRHQENLLSLFILCRVCAYLFCYYAHE